MPRLLIATKNARKAGEIRAMLGPEWEVADLTAFPEIPAPEETGATFAENAAIKALAASQLFSGLCLADDSGLEVDVLNGAPGVHSARYAGPNATDRENREKLQKQLSGQESTARFRCAMALAMSGRIVTAAEGVVDGRIISNERGAGGFGYDALFVPAGFAETFGQLSATIKGQLSHRARALEQIQAFLARQIS